MKNLNLKGAAFRAAFESLEKKSGPADKEVERLTAELETALTEGKDTAEIRVALRAALKQQARIQDEKEAHQARIAQRQQERIELAANGLVAAAAAKNQQLLNTFTFEL